MAPTTAIVRLPVQISVCSSIVSINLCYRFMLRHSFLPWDYTFRHSFLPWDYTFRHSYTFSTATKFADSLALSTFYSYTFSTATKFADSLPWPFRHSRRHSSRDDHGGQTMSLHCHCNCRMKMEGECHCPFCMPNRPLLTSSLGDITKTWRIWITVYVLIFFQKNTISETISHCSWKWIPI